METTNKNESEPQETTAKTSEPQVTPIEIEIEIEIRKTDGSSVGVIDETTLKNYPEKVEKTDEPSNCVIDETHNLEEMDMGKLGRNALHGEGENEQPTSKFDNGEKTEEPEDEQESTTKSGIPSTVISSDSSSTTDTTETIPAVKSTDRKEEAKKTSESIFSLSTGQRAILAILICFFAVVMFHLSKNPSVEKALTKEAKFSEEMNEIVRMLKSTESNLAFVNKSLTIFIREGEHEKPAIILLLGTNSSSCSLCRVLRHFVDALCHFYDEDAPVIGEGYIKASQVENRSANDGKIYIEDNIEQAASSEKHVVVMEDLDKFPVSSLSKVHSYLDHENAPHKDMVYILTGLIADHQEEYKIEKYTELNTIATQHFDDQWSEYEEDHRRALMGRMVSVIGYVHHSKFTSGKENENSCSDKCKT